MFIVIVIIKNKPSYIKNRLQIWFLSIKAGEKGRGQNIKSAVSACNI